MTEAMTRMRPAVLGVLVLTAGCLFSDLDPATAGVRILAAVVHVTDGDTLWAEIAAPGHGLAQREKVRLVGIDCPEKDQAPWGTQATARLSTLVLGGPVEFEVALQSRDRYGRLLGSIWRDGELIQERLVREGMCVPYVLPPNVEYADRIRAATEQARHDGVGIYESGQPLLGSPREYRRRRVGTDQA
jgi:micrococcal nuclease